MKKEKGKFQPSHSTVSTQGAGRSAGDGYGCSQLRSDHEQLGVKVKEGELLLKLATRDQAESSCRPPTPCSSGYPSRSPSPESQAILEEEDCCRLEEDRRRQVKESVRLVAQICA